jgi:hypothetical protein
MEDPNIALHRFIQAIAAKCDLIRQDMNNIEVKISTYVNIVVKLLRLSALSKEKTREVLGLADLRLQHREKPSAAEEEHDLKDEAYTLTSLAILLNDAPSAKHVRAVLDVVERLRAGQGILDIVDILEEGRQARASTAD